MDKEIVSATIDFIKNPTEKFAGFLLESITSNDEYDYMRKNNLISSACKELAMSAVPYLHKNGNTEYGISGIIEAVKRNALNSGLIMATLKDPDNLSFTTGVDWGKHVQKYNLLKTGKCPIKY